MNPLKSDEYPAVYTAYIETVVGDVMDNLAEQVLSFPAFLDSISEDMGDYTYAEGKWTIKEVLGHILDTERIMAYRALRFARNDMKELHGFDQENFVIYARHNERSIASFKAEFIFLRKANLAFFEHLSEAELDRRGMASERLLSVHALLYIIAGHLNHHRLILQERYLNTNTINDLVSELQH
ncbi:DinB family protein [Sphingobacteriaceae bacterium WQ 2009]|uniref:DinB family protein n=1 Tax=Rhinopithecimicrobium faecis TaxID=2820698 RepID=A0A8T4HAM9_9SPHI|nr:DinB family protein [Sphingobacteriaceae bacterium WQ 2009]